MTPRGGVRAPGAGGARIGAAGRASEGRQVFPGSGCRFALQAGVKTRKNAKNVKMIALAPRFVNFWLMCNKYMTDIPSAGLGTVAAPWW